MPHAVGTTASPGSGYDPNTGGVAFVRGSVGTSRYFVWSHELGHNLSYGHANVLKCTSGIPSTANGNCVEYVYGDSFDVMGASFGSGGTVSAPNSIDSGIWPSTDYYEADAGPTEYTINVASSNTGKRAIRVVDPKNGDVFYVEARSFTGRDAAGENWTPWYLPYVYPHEGVRILQRPGENDIENPPSWSGTVALAHADNQSKYYWEPGETYTSRSGTVDISVVSVSDTEAVVSVSALNWLTPGTSTITGTAQYGSTLTANTSGWATDADSAISVGYQWRRGSADIAGATESTYKLTAADVGSKISVAITGTVDDYPDHTATVTSAQTATVASLPITTSPVTVSGSASVGAELTATTGTWEPGVAVDPEQTIDLTYQWRRGSTNISGATSETYTVSSADFGKSCQYA